MGFPDAEDYNPTTSSKKAVLCITQNWAARVGLGYLRHLAVVEILES
jgi:hypothetical protein